MVELTKTDTSVLDAIHSRQSVPRVREDVPPREMIEAVLAAATCAPNHYRTEPWRFVVLSGDARMALGEVMAQSLRARQEEPESDDAQREQQRERAKPLRAPVIIAVAAVPATIPKVVEIEEIAAVAAGVENMLLAAQAIGLGVMWRTGPAAYDPAVKSFLELPEGASIVSFLYLGFPADNRGPARKPHATTHTRWLGPYADTDS